MLKITRSRAHAGSRNAFSVFCDGALLGTLRQGETAWFDLPGGDHEIYVRSRWGASKPRKVYDVEHDVSMFCTTNLDGIRAVLTLPCLTIFRNAYINVEKVVD
jgi:hypothetical protein